MTSAKLIFIAISTILFIILPFFIKNVRQYFLAMASSLYVFSTGWIFYHFNGLMLADLPILGLLALSLFSGRHIKWILHPVTLPLLGFIVWGLVSSFAAVVPGWCISESTKYLRMYLLIVVLVHNIRSMDDLRVVVNSMIGVLLVQVFIGIYQWRFGAVGLWFLGERAASRIAWRSMGTFFVPSFYANYLAMVLPVAFRLFIFYKAPNRKHVVLYGAALLFGVLALFSTYGRGPWVGFGFAIVILTLLSFLKGRFRPRLNWAIPVLIFFSLLFVQRYGSKVIGQFQQRMVSYEVRFPQFRLARRVISQNQMLGVGLGNYELVAINYMNERERADTMARIHASMVHNSYYLVTAEMGLPGGFFLILWFVSIFWSGYRIIQSKMYNPFIVNTAMGVLGGMAAIVVVFTFSPDVHSYQIQYQISLFSGILLAETQLMKNAAARKRLMEMSKKQAFPAGKTSQSIDRTMSNQLS